MKLNFPNQEAPHHDNDNSLFERGLSASANNQGVSESVVPLAIFMTTLMTKLTDDDEMLIGPPTDDQTFQRWMHGSQKCPISSVRINYRITPKRPSQSGNESESARTGRVYV